MKISVLIPAFQAGAFIGPALRSVRAQQHTDWELIVVEDGSHDDTADLVTRFAGGGPQPVVYENAGANEGVAAARNRLMARGRGDAFAFLDADDYWDPAHLANAVAGLERGAEIVVSDVRCFDLASGRPQQTFTVPAELIADPVLTLFRRSAIVTCSAVVLTRALAGRTGKFDEALRIGEDRDFWLRCALHGGRFSPTGAVTCGYARHASSSMARTYVVARHATRFYEKYRRLGSVPPRLRRHLLADSLVSEGRLLRAHDRARSAACFWRALRCEPFNPRILLHLAYTGWRSATGERAA